MKLCRGRKGRRGAVQGGFTLIELSLVLIVIGLIVGAVSAAKDLQRNAAYQKFNAVFVQSWLNAYQNYYNRVGIVIGDDPAAPTSMVNAGGPALCRDDLVSPMQQAGVTTPTGRGPGVETLFVFLDSNGNPQEGEVCFQNRAWSIPDGTGGFVTRQRNVMIITGLTPALARYLDAQIDGRGDARYGKFREDSQAAALTAASQDWSRDNRVDFDGNASNLDESQVGLVSGWYLMNP